MESKIELDLNKDGKLTQEDIDLLRQLKEIVVKLDKAESQSRIAMIAVFGMIFYAMSPWIFYFSGAEKVIDAIVAMSATFFASMAGIVMVFFGAGALRGKINDKT